MTQSLALAVFLHSGWTGLAKEVVQWLINVDFTAAENPAFVERKVGFAAVGQAANDVWNVYSRDDGRGGFRPNGALANLKWADGSDSGIGLNVTNAAGAWVANSRDPMMNSYLYPSGRTENITATITNLPQGGFDFYVYAHGLPGLENGVVEIQSGLKSYGDKATTVATDWNTTHWLAGQQYVVFENIIVSPGQKVVIISKPGVSGLAVINGLQIVQRRPISETVPETLTSNLVAYWNFDETQGTVAHDRVGSFDGTLSVTGASFVTGGISGRALRLDRAQNGFVRIGDWLGLTNGDYSIVAWVKTAPGDATESLIVLGKHEAYFNNGYFLNVNHSGFRGQDGKAMFFAGDPIPSPTSTTIVNDGRWHQIVGVYQAGGSTLLYVDGAPVEATTPSYPILGSPAALLIGGLQFEGVPQGLFTGWLDEIRIYRRALSAQEIDALFANPVPPGSGVARVSTLAGTGNSGFADGYGKAVSFASPNGGSVGANRFSYVADAFNQRVRRVDLQSGEVSTIAGNGGAGYTDGAGQNAQFSAPLGVFTSTTSWRTTAEGIWWS